MKTLKDKETDTIYYNITYEDGCHTHNMTEEFKGFYTKDVKEHLNDFIYLLQFYEGKIMFDSLRNNCINYFKSKYDINIMDLTLTESFKSIFGEFKK